MHKVMDMFVEGQNAICKIIQFNPVVSKWFHSAVQRMELPLKISNQIKDLGGQREGARVLQIGLPNGLVMLLQGTRIWYRGSFKLMCKLEGALLRSDS